MDPVAFRSEFPVFERGAYLNAGSCGPLPAAALRAGADAALRAAEEGRGMPYFKGAVAAAGELRAAYAGALRASAADVALTTCTSEGLVRMIGALGLQTGDEVLTAPDEHPGLLGPLAAARRALGISVRTAPFGELASAVEPGRTKLVACSHVNWTTGALAPAALREVGAEIPVLLDGAQGAGAIAVDVASLGCFAYAASGQKWMCGPVGTGMLWVDPAWRARLAVNGPTYMNLVVPADGLDAEPFQDARAFDGPAFSMQQLSAGSAAAGVMAAAGWDEVFAHAQAQCSQLVVLLGDAGREVVPRGPSTLVSWIEDDPAATVERAVAAGVTVRSLPGTSYVRASVGAWTSDEDLERLLAVL